MKLNQKEKRTSINEGLKLSLMVGVAFAIIMIIANAIWLILDVPIEEFSNIFKIETIFIAMIMVIVFFTSYYFSKKEIIRKKIIYLETLELFQDKNKIQVIPKMFEEYEDFFENLNILKQPNYFAFYDGEIIIIFLKMDDIIIRFEEISISEFLKKYEKI